MHSEMYILGKVYIKMFYNKENHLQKVYIREIQYKTPLFKAMYIKMCTNFHWTWNEMNEMKTG